MIYLFGGVGVIVLLLTVALGFEHERVVYETSRADAVQLKLTAAEERATALALLWSAQVDKTEAAKRGLDKETNVQFDALMDRIKHLPGRTCVAGADVEQLLGDIARAANAAGIATVDSASGAGLPTSPSPGRKND